MSWRRVAPLALALLFACSDPKRPGVAPRHVLLITVSALRADHVSAWLYNRPTTAETDSELGRFAIDGLAKSGVVFAEAFAPSGASDLSLASLHTGRGALTAGAPDAKTLAQAFQEAGFLTAAFTAGEAATRQSIPGFGFFQNEVGPDADYAAVRHAIEWLRAQDTAVGKNLFVWLHLAGPAAPYDPVPVGKTGFGDRFVDPDYAGPANGSLDYLAAARSAAADVSGQDLGQVTALYDAEIARVNHLVLGFVGAYAGTYGTLPVDHLTDTVLVFAADRGEELFQRNRAFEDPASVYDSALHVPLVFHHPGSLTGSRVVQEPVELADVMPTLLDWFQIDAPEGIEGRSLLPLVDSYVERPFDSRPVFGLWGDRIATARTSRFRLVWNPEGVDPGAGSGRSYPVPVLALFDHQRDPRELVDVAAEHPEVVAALREAIQGWLADGGDPLLLERFR